MGFGLRNRFIDSRKYKDLVHKMFVRDIIDRNIPIEDWCTGVSNSYDILDYMIKTNSHNDLVKEIIRNESMRDHKVEIYIKSSVASDNREIFEELSRIVDRNLLSNACANAADGIIPESLSFYLDFINTDDLSILVGKLTEVLDSNFNLAIKIIMERFGIVIPSAEHIFYTSIENSELRYMCYYIASIMTNIDNIDRNTLYNIRTIVRRKQSENKAIMSILESMDSFIISVSHNNVFVSL